MLTKVMAARNPAYRNDRGGGNNVQVNVIVERTNE